MDNLRITHEDKIKGIQREYEEIILGKRKNFSNWYFMDEISNGQQECHQLSLEVFRYCFEDLLHWTPETVYQSVSKDLLIQMHLYPLWKRQLVFPKNVKKNRDYYYIAYMLYPEIFQDDFRSETVEVYQAVLSGELFKIPKNFFDGLEGRKRAIICLQYLISQQIPYRTTEDLYQKFSETEIKAFLNARALLIPCTRFFESPIDFLHFSLPKQMRCNKDYAYTKRQYYRNRAKTDPEEKNIKKYLSYIRGKNVANPFFDRLNNLDYKMYGECMYYFIHHLLPTEVLLTSYNLSEPEELYEYLTTSEAEEMMKKYKIFDAAKAMSPNLVRAVDCILPSTERSMLTLDYAAEKYEKLHLPAKKKHMKITSDIQEWLDYVKSDADNSPFFNAEGYFLSTRFNECLWYFVQEIVPEKRSEAFEDVSEIYDYFLSEEAEKSMKEYKLWECSHLLSANLIKVVHGTIVKHSKKTDDASSYRYALQKYARSHNSAM